MRRKTMITIGVSVCVGVVVATVLAFALQPRESQGAAFTPSASSTPVSAPPPQTTELAQSQRNENSEEGHADETRYDFEDTSCELLLGSEVAELIKARVFAYERFWVMPDTAEKQTGIERFGTPAYVVNYSVFVDPTLELSQGPVKIGDDSLYTCRVSESGNAFTSIIPELQLLESEADDAAIVTSTTGVVHRSVWSLEDGEWRIAYEDWR